MKFLGYRRPEGRAGVRNLVVVMPGVLCSSSAAQKIVSAVPGTTFLYNHNGCGQSPSDTEHTLEVLSGLLANGNVYGALIVGLGCDWEGPDMAREVARIAESKSGSIWRRSWRRAASLCITSPSMKRAASAARLPRG